MGSTIKDIVALLIAYDNQLVNIINSRWRWVIIAVVLLATVAAVVIGSYRPEPNLQLKNLNNVSELREQFNQDASKVRVLLLLSPT